MTHIIKGHGAMRKVAQHLHRPCIMDVESEDCAPEGACPRDANQGRGPDCPQHPRKASPWIGPAMGIAVLILVGGIYLWRSM